jgi:hypothetical protein
MKKGMDKDGEKRSGSQRLLALASQQTLFQIYIKYACLEFL